MENTVTESMGPHPVDEGFTDISLKEKKKKKPRRILHFSDGILEEYSSEEEEELPKEAIVDPKTLTWFPWIWYYIVTASKKTLSVADACGENLAWFFGITTPKYQYAIDEYYRMKEEEDKEKEKLEMRRRKMEEEKLSHVEVDSVENRTVQLSDIRTDVSTEETEGRF